MIGFVFPGQGSQYVGMGKEFYGEKAKMLFDRADRILGFPLSEILFNGPEDVLRESKNAQVAILLHSIISFELLKDRGINPICVAGHSLGEYSALYAAKVFVFDDVLHLVRFRGELMSVAGETAPGTMAAIIGLNQDDIERIVRETEGVVIANYNSPLQIVISGTEHGVNRASLAAKDKGAKKVVQLPVSGAFHSPLMKSASEKFARVLSNTEFKKPEIPIAPNVTGSLTEDVEEIKDALSRQMISPVKWVDCVMAMKNYGVDNFMEIGPGKVLTGLVKKIVAQEKG